MAHFFYLPPNPRRIHPMPQPPQSQAEISANDFTISFTKRSDSCSSDESQSPRHVSYVPEARKNSALAAHRNPKIFNSSPGTFGTKSIGGFGNAGVVFERDASPTDDDVIIVTVRLSNKFRKSSVDGSDTLPSRPPPRSFFRRLSTRMTPSWDHSAEKEEKYKAIKMPRSEYRRHFARDRNGSYAGTEPEREWNEDELLETYKDYQDIPLHTILC